MADTATLLAGLEPDTRAMFRDFLARCAAAGKDVRLGCTARTFTQQGELFAIGRTTKGNPCRCGGKSRPIGTCIKHPLGLRVTNAGPGESWHNWHRAGDILLFRNGKIVWGTGGNGIDDNPLDDDTDDLELWERVGALGKAAGLEWAGDWKSFPEFPHFQNTGGLDRKALLAKYPRGL